MQLLWQSVKRFACGAVMGRISHFPTDLCRRPYNTLALLCVIRHAPSQRSGPQILHCLDLLPVPLDEPYRLRQTSYTLFTFSTQTDEQTDRYSKVRRVLLMTTSAVRGLKHRSKCSSLNLLIMKNEHTSTWYVNMWTLTDISFSLYVSRNVTYPDIYKHYKQPHSCNWEYLHWQLHAQSIKADISTSCTSFFTNMLSWTFSVGWQSFWLYVLTYITNDLCVWQWQLDINLQDQRQGLTHWLIERWTGRRIFHR